MTDSLLKSYNWIDGVIVLMLLIGAFRGYRSGFLRAVIGLSVTIGGVVAAIMYHPQVALWLNDLFKLQEKIITYLTPRITIPTMPISEADPIGFLAEHVLKMKLPQATLDYLRESVESLGKINVQAMAGNLSELVASLLASLLINALAFLTILVGIHLAGNVLLFFLRHILRVAGSLPDRLFGLAVGGLQSAALVVAVLALIVPILASGGQTTLAEAVSESMLADYLMKLYYSILSLFS
jgi:hypothetical protein